MPLTPAELRRRVEEVGRGLQEIQETLGRTGEGGRVRFPAGFIKTVNARTPHFHWIGDAAMKHNICYHLIFADVLDWLRTRTTLAWIAKDMVIKHTVTVMGAVVEALTIAACRRAQVAVGKFEPRIDRLVAEGAIREATGVEVKWLWTTRTSIHIHEVEGLEIDRYPEAHAARAIRAFQLIRGDLYDRFTMGR